MMTPEEMQQRIRIMGDKVDAMHTGLFKGDEFSGDGGFIKRFNMMSDKVDAIEAQLESSKRLKMIVLALAIGLIVSGIALSIVFIPKLISR